MSLNELIHRYSPERTREEKLHILDALAAHLPAPAFLWLGVAAEALKDTDASLRQAALHLLSHAPQGWDLVLVSGLTTPDEAHQQACLRVLAAMAFSSAQLQDAFHKLGELPGWTPAAIAVWEEARQQFPVLTMEETPEATEELEAPVANDAELEALRAAHVDLMAEKAELAETLARQAEEHEAQTAQLETLKGRLSEEMDALKVSLEHSQRERQVLAESVQETLHGYQQKQSRLVAACVAAALVAIAGVPAGWALGSRAALTAAEPLDSQYDYSAVTTPVHVAAADLEASAAVLAEPDPQALKEAEDAGYRKAMQALASRAADLEKQGYPRPAAAIWQSYARLATSPAEVKLGNEKSEALLKKLKPAAPARPVVKPPRALTVAPAAAVRAPARLPAPPAPPVAEPAALEDAIPEEIRSKF